MNTARQGLAVLLFLAVFAVPAFAQQGVIAGTATSSIDGAGLAAVQVQVLRSDGSVVTSGLTSASGAYRFDNLSAGTYSVSFVLAGWEQLTETEVIVRDGATTTVSASMLERAFTLNPISITTSKKVEKALDAPASVQVVDREDIAERPATSLTDHVKEKAGVDVVTTGLQSNHVVIRGFNNIFSGATLSLTDNRIARVPSLRVNLAHLQPTTNSDIDRVEVVLGPGSALYGPNAANGVIHYLTQSPIDAPGTSLSVAGGLRQQGAASKTVALPFDANQNGLPDDQVTVSRAGTTENAVHIEGRHAYASASGKFGVKLSGQYFTGGDYNFIDEAEVVQQALAGACLQAIDALGDAGIQSAPCVNFAGDLIRPTTLTSAEGLEVQTRVNNVANGRIDARDEAPELERYAFDLRADFRPSEDVNIILSGGRTTALNSIDLTGVGGGRVQNWDMTYGQARASYKNWFGQVFFNKNSNDETYLLRSGRPLIDRSSLFVTQLQRAMNLSESQSLILGIDYLHTVPQSEGTINGQHEDDDTVDEVGGYAQYEAALSDMFDLVLAARVDKHSRLDDPVFSPRAAIVYKPNTENSFRLTFNRAFTTPTTLNFFLDLSNQTLPIFGPFSYDIRVQGGTENGLSFERDGNNIPMHMSPFNPLLGGTARDFLPTTTEQMWATAKAVVGAGDPAAGGLLNLLGTVPGTFAPTAADIPVVAALLDPESGGFGPPILDLTSIDAQSPLVETTWQTLEAGYKGLVSDRWLIAVNGYWTKVNDFISALQPISPNVFLPAAATQAYLQTEFTKLVGIAFASQAEADATAAVLAQTIGQIPLGSIVPETAGGLTETPIIFTYRNLGDFDLFGADLAITYVVAENWELTGTAAWVSDEVFDSGTEDVPLNAPSFKGSLGARYRNADSGVSAGLRARFIDGFPVASGVYAGDVEGYSVFDLNFGIAIPGMDGLTAQLDVQNVLDNDYSTFPGTPNLGRYTVLRLLWAH
ncbi:MAG: TonB-dependent receptor [Gemmatimonadota bacterium]|nr:TonB-dependent receptor [Gemmatimonadota bacterium]